MSLPPTAAEFDIPQRSGEVLCLPPATEFRALAEGNAATLAASPLQLGEVSLAEVRRRARQWVSAAAAKFSRALKISASAPREDSLLLVTGHQPFLFHPGVWIKHLLVSRLAAGDGISGLSMPVDSDVFEELGVDVPTVSDGLQITHETLLRSPADVPYEAHARPSKEDWRAFLDRVGVHLRALRLVHEVFAVFVEQVGALEGPRDLGTFITAVRRRYEGPRPYLELPVSQLAECPQFRQFFLHILRDADRFADCYNRHLETYRARYNIRTAAQPFPNLEVERDRVELPFWILRDGRRRPCYAQPRSGGWQLWAGDAPVGTITRAGEEHTLEGLAIRPRALTLTAFTRLCVADLFVHGVGGGRYDRATDEVIREYFGIEPPRYAVVTATVHLPLTEFNTNEERQELQRRLLELRHNPDRVLATPSARERALIDEKWRLIATLKTGAMTRRERRQATQRIREINDLLAHVLEDERGATERRLADLATGTQAAAAATHRGYPFCFFPPSAIDELVSSIVPGR